jgi:hypothetical protein
MFDWPAIAALSRSLPQAVMTTLDESGSARFGVAEVV